MSEEDEIKKAWGEIEQAEREETEINASILNVARFFLSENKFNDVETLISESGFTSHYAIKNKPNGKYRKDSDYKFIRGYWANQTTNGGYIGDEYAGTISIRLSNGQYFQFNYSM